MDIGVLTNDNVLARFLVLELREAGYDADRITSPADGARLILCDLDACTDPLPENAVGFSYEESKRRRVACFLPRPIDVKLLLETIRKQLAGGETQDAPLTLRIDRATRRIRGDRGEVRLSEKELRLFTALCEVPLLDRATAAKIFGDGESNVVDVYMHYLRKKLKNVSAREIIRSKRGTGYALAPGILPKFV